MKKLFLILGLTASVNSAYGLDLNSEVGKEVLKTSVSTCVKEAFNGENVWLHRIFDHKKYVLMKELCTCAMEKSLKPLSIQDLIYIDSVSEDSEVAKTVEKFAENNMIECMNNK